MALKITERPDGIELTVYAQPRAARSEIAGEHGETLKVRLAAPPVAGAANDELVRVLARALGVARADVEIVRGHTARTKTVRVRGATAAALRQALGPRS